MKAFQEITEWDTDFVMPNHVYFLSDSKDKMYGYVKSGTGEIVEVSTPYRFKASGRKFREVVNTWKVTVDKAEPVEGRNWTVSGSKGDLYTVTENHGLWTCTCSGFKFRNQCRHVEEISNKVSLSE
jgi:hypothetical protein